MRLDGDLFEIDVIAPDVGAVGNQPLLVRFRIDPAKLARSLNLQGAGGGLEQAPVGINEGLFEISRKGYDVRNELVDERLAVIDGGLRGMNRRGKQQSGNR